MDKDLFINFGDLYNGGLLQTFLIVASMGSQGPLLLTWINLNFSMDK